MRQEGILSHLNRDYFWRQMAWVNQEISNWRALSIYRKVGAGPDEEKI